ncbi:magnesium and cobalt transport protein CorA [Candidimonas humi]|nr:magnesium and cobalt transport protein CorA [Candidimonas humi]
MSSDPAATESGHSDAAGPGHEASTLDAQGDSSVVASMLYRKGHEPREIPVSHIARYVEPGEHLIWVGLKSPEPALIEQLGAQLGFSSKAIEEINEIHRRPRVVEYTGLTQIVAITVEVETMRPTFGETQIIIGKGFLVTVRRSAQATHTKLRELLENSPELLDRGSDYVASMLLDLMADRYVAASAKIESGVEAVEKKFLLRGFQDTDVRRVYQYRRDLLRIHVAISPLVEICRRLSRVESNNIDQNCRGYFGEVADRVQRVDELLNSLREALAFAFEASLMIGQSQQTDITKKLASWAAILAVPTAVAGIYGMNFKYMPELSWTFGYPLIMGLTAGACAILYWRFKKNRWL